MWPTATALPLTTCDTLHSHITVPQTPPLSKAVAVHHTQGGLHGEYENAEFHMSLVGMQASRRMLPILLSRMDPLSAFSKFGGMLGVAYSHSLGQGRGLWDCMVNLGDVAESVHICILCRVQLIIWTPVPNLPEYQGTSFSTATIHARHLEVFEGAPLAHRGAYLAMNLGSFEAGTDVFTQQRGALHSYSVNALQTQPLPAH